MYCQVRTESHITIQRIMKVQVMRKNNTMKLNSSLISAGSPEQVSLIDSANIIEVHANLFKATSCNFSNRIIVTVVI